MASSNPQQVAATFESRRNELQALATRIGDLEASGDEHKLVLDTLRDAQAKDPERKCFRLIGGVLTEKTVKDVLPVLEHNAKNVRLIWPCLRGVTLTPHKIEELIAALLKQYKEKESQLAAFVREQGLRA